MSKLRKSNLGRRSKNVAVTRSGKALSINRSISARIKTHKAANQARRATYLSTLPKGRWQRILFRLHPKNMAKFWFSRNGGIMFLKIIGISIVIGFFLTVGLFAYFRKDLPKIKDLSGTLGGSITYYDRTGSTVLWQDYNAVKRTPVASDQISKYVKEATVAIEDKGFYHEGAFDVRGILRAAIHDALGGGGSLQGGSTITQQLVKLNQDWTSNRTVSRKAKELILSVELERQYSKDDILTGYLNIAPYGGLDYGVETAAQDYFHISAKNLSLAQAALLASIPQSPNYYSPYGSTVFNPAASNTFNKAALIGRQQYALDQMAKQGYITKAQAEEAKKVDILAQVQPLQNKYSNIKAPYFVMAAKKELQQKYTAQVVAQGGWKIITTLDLNLQTKAESLIANNLANVKRHGGDTEATVVESVPTGQMMALVGGVDFNQPDYGELNFADQVLIAPGSSFKPYDYTALINDKTYNAGAGSVLYDSQGPIVDPTTGAGYACTNTSSPRASGGANCLWDYDFRYPGPLTLRYAIGGSRNVPAVKAMVQAGVSKTISLASAMMDNTYLQSLKQNTYNCYKAGTDLGTATAQDIAPCYASSAIGDGAFLHLDDHVNGLATLARLGSAIPRTFLLTIKDDNGNTIYNWTQPKGNQVISPDTAYIMDNMLSDPNASYLGTKFQHWNGWNFAVKTGTTNSSFDGLMTSWSTQYAVATWVGYHTRNKTLSGFMEDMTQPITQYLMQFAHTGVKPVNWTQPSTVKSLPAFVVTTHVGVGSVEPSPSNDLYPGWYTPKSGTGTSDAIDKVSGLLATTCTPDSAKSTTDNSNTNIFSIDWFINGAINKKVSTASVAATDNVHLCGEATPKISPPSPPSSGCIAGTSCDYIITVTAGVHPFNDPQYSGNPGTVNLITGGAIVASKIISDGDCTNSDSTVPNAVCTVTVKYTPTTAGDIVYTASVLDSVLYSTTSGPSTVTTTASPSPIVITSPAPSATNVGNTASITWTGGSGTFTLKLDTVNVNSCTGTTRSCTVSITLPGSHTIVVSDDALDTTGTVTFTK